jgi:hypothetical protein
MKKFKNTIEVRRLNSQVEEFKTLVINNQLTISSTEVTKEDTGLHLIESTTTLTEAQTPLELLIEAQIEVQFIIILQVVVDIMEILLDKIIEAYE